MALSLGTFRFVLQSPDAKLMDCRAGSLIVPTHDGQMGVLRNHMPMLAKLGLGIMQVCDIVYEKGRPGEDRLFLIDSGFLRISENNVIVLAYDVETFDGVEADKTKKIIDNAKHILAQDADAAKHRKHDIQKAAMLIRLARQSELIE